MHLQLPSGLRHVILSYALRNGSDLAGQDYYLHVVSRPYIFTALI